LIEPWPSVGHIYAQEASRDGAKTLPAEIINLRFAQAWKALKDFRYTRPEWAELVDTVFRGLVEAPPSKTFFSTLYSRFARAAAWRIFPDVLPALDRLTSRGLRLGVISNWDRRLRPLLRELKLHDYFQIVVVSCDLHVQKPSAEIFRHAAHRLRLPVESILHVGDNIRLDVQGAQAVGMRGLQLYRRPAARVPAGTINSLNELEKHLI
jgi:putative hydrolase of the HAD superfamily